MNNIPGVIEWLSQMGYDGEIPETLNKICTNSTAFIWDQLLVNAKPRQEVDLLRKNIIIRRLQKKPLNKQDEFSYPVKEISLCIQKQKLEAKLKGLEANIAEKQNKVNSLSRDNKLKYIFIERANTKIKGNQEREYILQKKCEMLEQKIQEMDEMLTVVGNITPVEVDEHCDTKQITGVLEECAKKLEQILKTLSPTEVQIRRNSMFFSARKPDRPPSVPERYLSRSEIKSANKTSAMKIRNALSNKENKQLIFPKKLFPDDSFPAPNRDSLGLLPEFSLEDIDRSIFDIMKEIDLNTLVVKKNISIQEDNNLKPQPSVHVLENICKDQIVGDKLTKLLQKHNRQIIWNLFQSLDEDLRVSIIKNLVFDHRKKLSKSINRDDLIKLQAKHVQTELQIMKMEVLKRNLTLQVTKKIEETKAALGKPSLTENRVENIMHVLDLHLKDIGLDASITLLKREIDSAKTLEDNKDLQMMLRKLGRIKENISMKSSSINGYLEQSKQVLHNITRTREETLACVRKLGPFVNDMAWAQPLNQDLCSEEMQVFEDFPLEYNRRFTYTDPSIYFHNVCTEILPFEEEFNTDTMYMLSEILENPLSPPEAALLNLLKCKMKVDLYGRLKNYISEDTSVQNYSLQDLRQQESYLEFAINRLVTMKDSSSTKKSLSIANYAKKYMDMWMEMPFKNFISVDRMLDGKDYKYYENRYNEMYNNL